MNRPFAVVRTQGPAWTAGRPLEEQPGWDAHAAFMDGLHESGFVVLGGPLAGTRDVLLIVRADGPDEIRERLAADPWSRGGLLSIRSIAPWTLRLGALD